VLQGWVPPAVSLSPLILKICRSTATPLMLFVAAANSAAVMMGSDGATAERCSTRAPRRITCRILGVVINYTNGVMCVPTARLVKPANTRHFAALSGWV
jgi:hypothetical protein